MLSRFRTLHVKLVAAFVFVIFVALFAAGLGVAYLVQSYQRQVAMDQLRALALVMTGTAQRAEARGVAPAEVAAVLEPDARQLGVRVLLVDELGTVVAEAPSNPPEGSLRGQQLEVPEARPLARGDSRSTGQAGAPGGFLGARLREPLRPAVWRAHPRPLTRPMLFITVPAVGGLPPATAIGRRPAAAEQGGRPELLRARAYRLVVGVPEQSLTAAWLEMAPSLALAALAALAVSVGVALWLSRSISRPVREMTRAAEAIGRGDYQVWVAETGRDEVSQLGRAFNRMAHEVERSHRTLREFVANASHELRTPLTSVQGFAQAIAEQAVTGDRPVREAAGVIYDESERMRRLVEDLLYLSRMESGELELEQRPVDLVELLRAEVRRFEAPAAAKGVTLRLELRSGAAPLLGDPGQLEHLFGNLLDNAVKYTPEGGAITVTVTEPVTEPVVSGQWPGDGEQKAADAEPSIKVPIHNTGSYIPPEHLPRLFERFYRVEASRRRGVDGSGLGLAIAQQIATAHGGTIAAASDAEAGTTFTIALPLAQPDETPATARHPATARSMASEAA